MRGFAVIIVYVMRRVSSNDEARTVEMYDRQIGHDAA